MQRSGVSSKPKRSMSLKLLNVFVHIVQPFCERKSQKWRLRLRHIDNSSSTNSDLLFIVVMRLVREKGIIPVMFSKNAVNSLETLTICKK